LKKLPYPYPKFEDLEIHPYMANGTYFIGDWSIDLRITKVERKSSLAPLVISTLNEFDETFKNID
jgi:hypothetical protein